MVKTDQELQQQAEAVMAWLTPIVDPQSVVSEGPARVNQLGPLTIEDPSTVEHPSIRRALAGTALASIALFATFAPNILSNRSRPSTIGIEQALPGNSPLSPNNLPSLSKAELASASIADLTSSTLPAKTFAANESQDCVPETAKVEDLPAQAEHFRIGPAIEGDTVPDVLHELLHNECRNALHMVAAAENFGLPGYTGLTDKTRNERIEELKNDNARWLRDFNALKVLRNQAQETTLEVMPGETVYVTSFAKEGKLFGGRLVAAKDIRVLKTVINGKVIREKLLCGGQAVVIVEKAPTTKTTKPAQPVTTRSQQTTPTTSRPGTTTTVRLTTTTGKATTTTGKATTTTARPTTSSSSSSSTSSSSSSSSSTSSIAPTTTVRPTTTVAPTTTAPPDIGPKTPDPQPPGTGGPNTTRPPVTSPPETIPVPTTAAPNTLPPSPGTTDGRQRSAATAAPTPEAAAPASVAAPEVPAARTNANTTPSSRGQSAGRGARSTGRRARPTPAAPAQPATPTASASSASGEGSPGSGTESKPKTTSKKQSGTETPSSPADGGLIPALALARRAREEEIEE